MALSFSLDFEDYEDPVIGIAVDKIPRNCSILTDYNMFNDSIYVYRKLIDLDDLFYTKIICVRPPLAPIKMMYNSMFINNISNKSIDEILFEYGIIEF